MGLVILVIYLFLGSVRAMLVPAVSVPVSLVASFLVLLALDFSVNILTLLALVLAIGLVVDDAIVVLENIHRRMEEYGETRLVAAYRGTRQVGFAVVATTIVLIAVFVPIAFLQGDAGRLFSEFALTMAAAVAFSSVVALSLSPMLASKVLPEVDREGAATRAVDWLFAKVRRRLSRCCCEGRSATRGSSSWCSPVSWPGRSGCCSRSPANTPQRRTEAPSFVLVNGPEGASYDYIAAYMTEVERRLMPLVESGEITRLLVRAPRAFGNFEIFNTGIVINVLDDWSARRSAWAIMDDVRARLKDLPGVRAFPVMRQGFGARIQKPVQFVLGGGTYEQLAEWRDTLLAKINESNPGLTGINWDYKETKPQLQVVIDYDRAADLGVTVGTIGRTLETMLGSRRVTTYIDAGEEYDVILEGERDAQRSPTDLQNLYVASARSGELIPLSNLVRMEEFADSIRLNRYNRVRAVTIEANLKDDLALGDALDYLENLVREHLPGNVIVDYKGQSRDFRSSGGSILFVFLLGSRRRASGAGRPVRELGPSLRHHAHGSAGHGGGTAGPLPHRPDPQPVQSDRAHHAGGPGGQERHPDRGVRQSAARPGQGVSGGPARSGGDPPQTHRDDRYHHGRRLASLAAVLGPRHRDPRGHRHRDPLRRAGRDSIHGICGTRRL